MGDEQPIVSCGLEEMEYSIRSVRVEDARSIIELLNPIIAAGKYTIMDEEISVEEQTDFIRGFPERGVFHVAASAARQEILGLQSVEPLPASTNALKHVGEISTYVSLAARRNGIGRSLSQATFRAAKERGFLKIIALIRADNPPAVAFYGSQGFKVIGTAQKHAFVRGQYIDEVLMERFI